MTYDQEFAEAMKLKLDLNRKAKAKKSSQASEASAAPRGLYDRDEEVNKLIAKHPRLTRETAEKGLEEMGF
tara:strand:- start:214 stop:426 length:213 start_codon:yes stop_codon:yes gene_type:complete